MISSAVNTCYFWINALSSTTILHFCLQLITNQHQQEVLEIGPCTMDNRCESRKVTKLTNDHVGNNVAHNNWISPNWHMINRITFEFENEVKRLCYYISNQLRPVTKSQMVVLFKEYVLVIKEANRVKNIGTWIVTYYQLEDWQTETYRT